MTVMTEPVMADTAAWDDGGETAVVDDMPTAAAAELAWSDLDTREVAPPRDPRPLSLTLTVLLVGVCVGAVVLAAFVIGQRHSPPASAPPPAASSAITAAPASTPATVPPASAPVPSEVPRYVGADARFLASIHADAVPYASGDDDAIVSAHQVCNWLADSRYSRHPQTVEDEIDLTRTALGWTYQQSNDFVTDAVRVYCPEQAR